MLAIILFTKARGGFHRIRGKPESYVGKYGAEDAKGKVWPVCSSSQGPHDPCPGTRVVPLFSLLQIRRRHAVKPTLTLIAAAERVKHLSASKTGERGRA